MEGITGLICIVGVGVWLFWPHWWVPPCLSRIWPLEWDNVPFVRASHPRAIDLMYMHAPTGVTLAIFPIFPRLIALPILGTMQ